jgi:phospho-N-acetylmuramoyl-pentapeptide-transferase
VIAVMMGGAFAIVFSLVSTRVLIRFFRDRGKGQPILGKADHGPEHHLPKQGTPTMGGLAIVGSAFLAWLLAHFVSRVVLNRTLAFSTQAMIVWVGILVMATMGFLDDYIKVRKMHNRGIFWKQKGYLTLALSIGLAWWLVAATEISTTLSITRADLPGWDLPTPVYVLFAGLIIWSTTNAVNVTDGLDGLAGGSAMMGFLAFAVIAYWAFRYNDDEAYRFAYGAVVNPLDMAVLASAFAGACGGFLWFNAAPARIFMGDVGALGIGAALAFLALTTNTQLLLVLICGINVIEAGSVAVQMGVFKASGRKKRLFKMSPIHHHFELSGWPETTVIIRFWLISGVLVALAVGIFIGDFTRLVERFGER